MKAKLPEKDELAKLLDTICANDTATAKLPAALKIIAMFQKQEEIIGELRTRILTDAFNLTQYQKAVGVIQAATEKLNNDMDFWHAAETGTGKITIARKEREMNVAEVLKEVGNG